MYSSNEDYLWKFTGYPWLDGIIFAAASPKNSYSVRINVSCLPAVIVEKIEDAFNEIGFEAGCIEVPNAITKNIDLRIEVIGPSPLFNTVPRFRERRLDLDNIPKEFIKGLFTVSIKVKMGKYSNKPNFKGDGIMIRSSLPEEDILQLLAILGIEEYRIFIHHIYLDRDIFEDKEPFEEIYQEFVKEDKDFSSYHPSKEHILDRRIKELTKKILLHKVPKSDKTDMSLDTWC